MTDTRPPTRSAFWVRPTDLERLYTAQHVCYLIGGYDGSRDYGALLQIAANVARIGQLNRNLLLVPLLLRRHAQLHNRLCREQSSLFRNACILFYGASDESPWKEAATSQEELLELSGPPSAFAQVLIYGSGSSGEQASARSLQLLETLDDWHSINGQALAQLPVLLVNQQMPPPLFSSPSSTKLSTKLSRAAGIGMRDESVIAEFAGTAPEDIESKLFVSGDDAATYIVISHQESQPRGRPPAESSNMAGSKALTINFEVASPRYASGDRGRLYRAHVNLARDLVQLCHGKLSVNLLADLDGLEPLQIKPLETLRQRLSEAGATVNFINPIEGLQRGFLPFSQADLTISSTYPVALTSLILSVPTVLLRTNEHDVSKPDELIRIFGVPDGLVLDLEESGRDERFKKLGRAVLDHDYRRAAAAAAVRGTADVLTKNIATTTRLCEFFNSHYAAALEAKYQSTVGRLSYTMEQLSDIQLEYGRLLNCSAALQQSRSREIMLENVVDERTAWAERMIEEAERRLDVIHELQAALDERTAWAERLAEEAERRLVVIQGLQSVLGGQSAGRSEERAIFGSELPQISDSGDAVRARGRWLSIRQLRLLRDKVRSSRIARKTGWFTKE
jgi:hypothetical protein